MKNKFKGKLFCFTPEVALATFITEIILAVYLFIKERTSHIGRLSMIAVLLLSVFQLSEYLICRGGGDHFWQVVGGLSINFLPPLGLYIISEVTGKRFLSKLFLFLSLVFGGMMLFVPGAISTASCVGNYIIFRSITDTLKDVYKIYYLSGLVFGMLGALDGIRIFKNDVLKVKLLKMIIIGYSSFMIPTSVVILIPSFGLESLPSVLCGFAVILALILTFFIVPLAKKLNI